MRQEWDDVGRGYYNLADLDTRPRGGSADAFLAGIDKEKREPCLKEEANLISSLCRDGLHRLVLDFDFPTRYVASATPGHGHLYIDKEMTWENALKLLRVMDEVGLLEHGYVMAAEARKATHVRPEWVKKPGPRPFGPAKTVIPRPVVDVHPSSDPDPAEGTVAERFWSDPEGFGGSDYP